MKAKQRRKAAVVYLRVSTREQGISGLGLDAQRRSVETFCSTHGYQVTREYKDIESGKHNNRPGLRMALAEAKALGGTLIIAKLDRLSRNAAFIMALRDSGVDFIAADMPEANTLTVGIMALLAQQERELISTRTKAALAELKAKGKKLGNDNITAAAREKSIAAKRAAARAFHNGALTHALNYRAAGWTLQRIADELNKAGATTRHGHPFTATTVLRLLKLAAADTARA